MDKKALTTPRRIDKIMEHLSKDLRAPRRRSCGNNMAA